MKTKEIMDKNLQLSTLRTDLLSSLDKINVKNKSNLQVCQEVSACVQQAMKPLWNACNQYNGRKAYYLSMEFLVGRLLSSNLLNLGVLSQVQQLLLNKGVDLEKLEDFSDYGLGNGGLGRLAACFIDSAACLDLPLYGHGIRYQNGLFKQSIVGGMQQERPDDWLSFGDFFGVRKQEEKRQVHFKDFIAEAIPWDYAVVGDNGTINTLRLWQASGSKEAERISLALYPDDSTNDGKLLRIRQEYFFCACLIGQLWDSAKLDKLGLEEFVVSTTIQLNDTHPVLAICCFIELALKDGVSFSQAIKSAKKIFNYTNHTIMAEALEKWDLGLITTILPRVADLVVRINDYACQEWTEIKLSTSDIDSMSIVKNNIVNMANLAVYMSNKVNGVAKIHTQIIKDRLFNASYKIDKDKFVNKTNGITHRRWLWLINNELCNLIDSTIGTQWHKDFNKLKSLDKYINSPNNAELINGFDKVKLTKKTQLAEYIKLKEGVVIDPNWQFYIHIKRIHEYKRQAMAALGILVLCNKIKNGELKDFAPTVFIFGGKAAASYKTAKQTIHLINAIGDMIDKDSVLSKHLKVVFVTNYGVSYAQKLIPAANLSLQISTAGTEASGTGNMKFMLNGTPTLGTLDGANVEIVELAGQDNNYIFGATVEQIASHKANYNPQELTNKHSDIKQALSSIQDIANQHSEQSLPSTQDTANKHSKQSLPSTQEIANKHSEQSLPSTQDITKINNASDLIELYNTLINSDNYMALLDLNSFVDTILKANKDIANNKNDYIKKCLYNTSNASFFSSDRTIKEYASEIWGIDPI